MSRQTPSGWDLVTVADVAEVQGGIQKQQSRRPIHNKYPFLRVANVGRATLDLDDVHEVELFDGEIERLALQPGDLLVVEGNGSPDQIGRSAMWHGEIANCVHQNHLIRVRPKSALLPRFLEFLWNGPAVTRQLRLVSNSTSGLYTLSTTKIKAINLAIPSLEEQHKIVAVLERAELLRVKRREAIALLDDLAQSIFLDIFGPVPNLIQEWSSEALSAVTRLINDCPHSTPQWTEEGEICLRTSNLLRGEWDWNDTRFVSKETFQDRSKRGYIEPGDIILSREGTVGIAAIVEEGMRLCMGQRLVQVRARPDILTPRFLLQYLLEILSPERIARHMAGSTSQHLNLRDLRSLHVPIPPLGRQREFENRLAKVAMLKTSCRIHLSELDALFASLQDRAFRGELFTERSAAA